MMDEVCDFFDEFIERFDAENGEGERGETGATAAATSAAAGVILGAVGWLLGCLATSSAFKRWWGRRSDGRRRIDHKSESRAVASDARLSELR